MIKRLQCMVFAFRRLSLFTPLSAILLRFGYNSRTAGGWRRVVPRVAAAQASLGSV